MENTSFQPSDFLLKGTYQNDKEVSEQIAVVRKYLDSKGVNINTSDYKNGINYMEIRDKRIDGFPGGAMSLDEFICRFMHTFDTFENEYDLGNPSEIEDSGCTDYAVASEICYRLLDCPNKVEETDVTEEIIHQLKQKGGLIERIKKYLGVDLNTLARNDNREKRERSKILYFFYMLEHRHYPKINVLMLLDKPSMESIDNKFLGWQTRNGEILRTVKEALGKELPLEEKGRIYSTIAAISIGWDNVLDNARLLLDFLYDYGFDYNSIELLPSPIPLFITDKDGWEDTYQYPVEKLYLIVCQREYLGNLFDIAFVNKIQNSNN